MKLQRLTLLLAIIFLLPLPLQGQANKITVPPTVRFANIHFHLTPKARQRVQGKVNNILYPRKKFEQLLHRTNLWFPLIEKILHEEGVPNDFKYLSIQESQLIGHIVGPNNDVGFWQIIDSTAQALKMDTKHPIDERMHIARSTKAAARLLKDQHAYFKSWLGALLAYNRGRRGAEKKFPKKYHGLKSVKITDTTDTYIIHFIAHKLAFAQQAGKNQHPTLRIYEYKNPHGKTLQSIAKKFCVEESLLKSHNAWLKCNRVPHYTTCSVIIPMTHHAHHKQQLHIVNKSKNGKATSKQKKCNNNGPIDNEPTSHIAKHTNNFPVVAPYKNSISPRIVKINGIPGVIAKNKETIYQLAALGKIPLNKFLTYNEIDGSHVIQPGNCYYYTTKNNKGGRHYHTVQARETLWKIAQKYGVKQSNILEKNRCASDQSLQVGRVLWLRFIRPRNIPVAYE